MITEDYVSFEVAWLLKEKGFDETCYACYEYFSSSITMYSGWPFEYKGEVVNNSKDRIKCPTHQMAVKWLREKHYIYADPIKQGNYNDCSGYYTWIVARMGIIHRNSTVVDKLSYEEAVEAALKYSLKNLI